MKALLWKDARLTRSVFILGGVLLLLPYVGALIMGAQLSGQSGESWWGYDQIMRMGFISVILTLIPTTMLAGNALAREREDHSAQFLACLPPTRWLVLTSKLVIAGGATLLLWAVNVAVILGIAPRMHDAPAVLVPGVHDNPVTELYYIAAVAVLLFGVAWLCSSVVSRASTAVAAGLLWPLILLLAVILGRYAFQLSAWNGPIYLWASLVLGLGGFALGSLFFVRRFEP